MNIGALNQRIRIESKQVAVNPDYGTQTITWVTFATVWAGVRDILPGKSAEKQPSGIRIEHKPVMIRTRYMTGITSDMRIVLLSRSNKVMQIVAGPSEFGRKEGLEFIAEEYSTDGQA